MTVTAINPPANKIEYTIDRGTLIDLREMKLINDTLYTYFAIKLTYTTTVPAVDVESFCLQWEMKKPEFFAALASLQKKGALSNTAKSIQLELF